MMRQAHQIARTDIQVASLLDAADFLDGEIAANEAAILDTIAAARNSLTAATKRANDLQVSYGLAVLAASVFLCGECYIWEAYWRFLQYRLGNYRIQHWVLLGVRCSFSNRWTA